MHFDSYQDWAKTTAIHPKGRDALHYLITNLASEAGEVAGVWAKTIRDDEGLLSEDGLDKMIKELGDCLWHIARIADELGYDLSEVAVENVTKIEDRKKRKVLGGSGDFR